MSQRLLVTGATGFIGGEGLAVPTVVTDPSGMELFEIEPVGFDDALRHALTEDLDLGRLAPAAAGAG